MELRYNRMTSVEVENFKEMFSVFQDLILAMVRNAVRVLPKDKTNLSPSLTAHLKVNSATKHNQEYDKFIDIKDVFLSCISNEERRDFFAMAMLNFTLNDKQKIKFRIKRSVHDNLDEDSRIAFKEDIILLEKIINSINDNFNLRLPEAKQQGKLMISKIRRIDIPQKAKYTGKAQDKSKGRGV